MHTEADQLHGMSANSARYGLRSAVVPFRMVSGARCGATVAAEGPAPRFAVTCKHCGRRIALTIRIREPEILAMNEHVRSCLRPGTLSNAPQLGELLVPVRVTAE